MLSFLAPELLGLDAGWSTLVRTQLQLRRANRTLRTISSCKKALMRAESEAELLEEIPKIIVDHGGYRMAWVGFIEHDEDCSIRIAAVAGTEDGYLRAGRVSWGQNERGQGPVGRSVRTGQPTMCADFETDPSVGVWRNYALKCGYKACLALPLRDGEEVFGVFAVYVTEAGQFISDESALLAELAEDLAYGIVLQRRREAHRATDMALQLSEARFRAALQHSPIGAALVGLDGRFLEANRALCAILGYSQEELLEKDFKSITHPDDVAADLAEAARLMVGEIESYQRQKRYLHKDGRVLRAELYAAIVRDPDGTPQYALGQIQDITERLRSEQGLRDAEERFRQVVENLQGVFWMTNLAKSEMLYVSPSFEEIWGYSCQSLYADPMQWLESIHPEDRERILAAARTKQPIGGRACIKVCSRSASVPNSEAHTRQQAPKPRVPTAASNNRTPRAGYRAAITPAPPSNNRPTTPPKSFFMSLLHLVGGSGYSQLDFFFWGALAGLPLLEELPRPLSKTLTIAMQKMYSTSNEGSQTVTNRGSGSRHRGGRRRLLFGPTPSGQPL